MAAVLDDSGFLGIGTSTPKTLLHLKSTAAAELQRFSRTAITPEVNILLASNAYTLSGVGLGFKTNNAAVGYGFEATNDSTYDFVITSAGRIGIATTSPTTLLYVGSNTTTDGNIITVDDATAGTCTFNPGGTSGDAFSCTSDARVKKNVERIDNGLEKIIGLQT
jgi:hypothetical protein